MLSLISLGALPLALFGLGGILIRYKFSNDLGKVFIIILLTILAHPIIAFVIGFFYANLDMPILRSVIICASMGPGINAFLFANFYKEGEKVSIIECKPISKKKTWQVME